MDPGSARVRHLLTSLYDCAEPDAVIEQLTRRRNASPTCLERAPAALNSDLVAAHLAGGDPGAFHTGPPDGHPSAPVCVLLSASEYDALLAVADQTSARQGVVTACLADLVDGLSDTDLTIATTDWSNLSGPSRSRVARCTDPRVVARGWADGMAQLHHVPPDVDCLTEMLSPQRLEDLYRRDEHTADEILDRCYDTEQLTADIVADLPERVEADDTCISEVLAEAAAEPVTLRDGPISAGFFRGLWGCYSPQRFVELVVADAASRGADVAEVDRECIAVAALTSDLGATSQLAHGIPHDEFRSCGIHIPG